MSLRILTIVGFSAVSAFAAASAVAPSRPAQVAPLPHGPMLHFSAGRSAQQTASKAGSKFDAALAGIARNLGSVRAASALADLHAINPAVRFVQPIGSAGPLVLIDAVTTGNPLQLKSALVDLGLQHAALYSNDVGGWLPVSQLNAAVARAEVHSIRAAMSRTRTGAVTSQGDFAQHSDTVRTANALSGAGVTVGVLSDSFDCYAQYQSSGNPPAGGQQGYAPNGYTATASMDVTTGDLPSGVNVLEEANCSNYGQPIQLPFGDEGRAMLQVVHDVAPGAALAFYTAENSEADFANGIGKLGAAVASGGAGAKVIIDDVGYFDEPFFQDGMLAQAVDASVASGVTYFSAAGNNSNLAYDNDAPTFAAVSTTAPNAGEQPLNFIGTGGATATSLQVSIPAMSAGEFVAVVLEWDQPFVTGAPNSGGATSQMDLCITASSGNDIIDGTGANGNLVAATCSGKNALGADPVQVLFIDYPANAATSTSMPEVINLYVGLAGGTMPGHIKVAVEDDGLGSAFDPTFATNSATLQGHPGAANAAAVGAAFFADTPACGATAVTPEFFSAEGGAPILFDVNGARLPTPVVRQKPDFLGPDGVGNTFLGFPAANGATNNSTVAACQNLANFPSFFGTSAAAPHVAGIAALMLQANAGLTPAAIYTAMRSTATSAAAFDPVSGFGLVQAVSAFAATAQAVPAAPTLTLGATSIVTGTSTTLSWLGANSTGCTASGSWSGALANQGSQTISPTAVGTDAYTLICTNAAGASTAQSVTLTVTAAKVPAAPTLTLGATSIVTGSSTMLSWTSTNSTGCTASGSWSGALASQGSQTISPTTVGTDTYTLICTNSAGSSTAQSVTLTVTAMSTQTSGGGGHGGALDWVAIFGLVSLLGARAMESGLRRRRSSPRVR